MRVLQSKLPDVGTTIFAIISQRAEQLSAVNLGQGFPDYPIDPLLGEHLAEAIRAGHNQYAPMVGLPNLREWIANDVNRRYGAAADPSSVTITLGATEAIFSAILALVGAGDEVIVFDPAYDSYDPAVQLAGARCVHIPLSPPHFRIDWGRAREAITPRTRMIIVNSPQNPACTVMTSDDLQALAELAEKHDLLVISDEVYEHIVFPGSTHHSVLSHPSLRHRSLAMFSFGKSLHVTGIRVGYCVAPAMLTAELRKVHQFNTFTIATAFQHGITSYLSHGPDMLASVPAFFARKRELLTRLLAPGPFRVLPSQGTYFSLVDYSQCEPLAGLDDMAAAHKLLEEAGVASIPLTPFYKTPLQHTLLRLCFAKQDATLAAAAERMCSYDNKR
jgi:methionine transaminase